ncbi:DNA repair protein Rad5 [Cryptococcus bacillisporus CA1873]|uniref:DNA repair protein Rad5 n=1 Tax=Cryptococcus bacillisporus CA1873 TaxID=1296111 RepID=A0ABR5B7P8_CRYGA|nr:DNA repair protein Rad5 [Cryptococcus bacillisporus CA1873]|eukprot:KIR59606.1 DNA repair protein Rad5 [Cryptococcus gattii CA1873]
MSHIDYFGGQSSTAQKRRRQTQPTSSQEEDDDPRSRAFEHDEHFATFRSDVVGVQYYRGLVGRGEYVLLRREPTNKWDSNAVQVINAGGSQVGHIPRAVAANLAALMDSNQISVEGRMVGQNLDGVKHFKLALDVSIYLNHSTRESLESALRWVSPGDRVDNQAPRPVYMSQSQVRGTAGSSVGLPQSVDNTMKELLEGLSRDNADLKQVDKVMDALTSDFDVSKLPLHPAPPGTANGQLLTNLLPHQSQALQWMITRENPQLPKSPADPAVQFWVKQKGVGNKPDYWLNVATKTPQTEAPQLGRGGIIADGMGLGKTLTTISLVLATKNDPVGDKVSQSTLIVCPLSVLGNWEKQIRDHVAPTQLNFYTYHGAAKGLTAKKLGGYDIVLTTYQTVAGEDGTVPDIGGTPLAKKPRLSTKKAGPLATINWKRVVADEGHQLKNPKAKMTIAFANLSAERRWVCTGTPIVNSPNDLGSLLTCLHICAPLSNPQYFRALLLRPLSRGDPTASKLLQAVVSQILLRRTKDSKGANGANVIELPEIEFFRVPVNLDDETRKVYEEVLEHSKRRFEETLRTGEGAANVLSMLTRMRQLCLSLELVPQSFLDEIRAPPRFQNDATPTSIGSLSNEAKDALVKKLRQFVEDEIECGICMDEVEFAKDPAITDCGHPFCLPCIERVITGQGLCPMDRHPIAYGSILRLPSDEDVYIPFSQARSINSAKIDELVKYLGIFPRNDKTLVFSQFTSFLDCVGVRLEEEGIKFVRFDGRMSGKQRTAVIKIFQEPIKGDDDEKTPRVMLISLKSGAVGLNLTAASNVFLCDPWWQSAIEAQAIDRAHRMGQKKVVRVFQLIAEDTIESSVLDIQKRKDVMVGKAFEKTSKESQKTKKEARFEDIKELLGMK